MIIGWKSYIVETGNPSERPERIGIIIMMTLQEVQDEFETAEVFTTDEFLELVEVGEFDDSDSYGYYHDGDEESDERVELDVDEIEEKRDQYPYIIWYNE